jgi:hypothetical protein
VSCEILVLQEKVEAIVAIELFRSGVPRFGEAYR